MFYFFHFTVQDVEEQGLTFLDSSQLVPLPNKPFVSLNTCWWLAQKYTCLEAFRMSPDLMKLSLVLPSTVIITHSSLKSPMLMSEVVSKRLFASFLLAVHVHSCTDGTCVFPRSGESILLPLLTEVVKGKEHPSLHFSSVVQLLCSSSGCSYQKTCTGATESPGLCSV